MHAASARPVPKAGPPPVAAPVATTVAPPPTVPLAVLGARAERAPAAGSLAVGNPFTEANLAGLVALVMLGSSMALFGRVHVTRLRVARAGSPVAG